MGSILCPKRIVTTLKVAAMSDIHNIKSTCRGNAWLKTVGTHYHAQLGLSDKVMQSCGW